MVIASLSICEIGVSPVTVTELLQRLSTAHPDADVTIGCLVELVDQVHVVNHPAMGGSYVVLLPKPEEMR